MTFGHIKKSRARARMARQVECFPRLDLVAAMSARDRLVAPVCVFSLLRRTVGQLFLAEVHDESVTVNYLFASEDLHGLENAVVLPTTVPRATLGRYFLCPTCNKSRRDLYYAETWACRRCHGLLHRSQLIDKEVKLWEERAELHALLKRGRPKHMHNTTYTKHRLRLAHLEGRLHGREEKVASEEHNAIITERWVAASEIELWSDRYTVHGGKFVRRSH